MNRLFNSFRASLAKRSEFWRTNQNDPHGISTAVYVALKEIAEATTEAEIGCDSGMIHVAITRKEFRSLPTETQGRILSQQAEQFLAAEKAQVVE